MCLKILVLWLVSIVTLVLSADPCELHTNCRECILDANQCRWCSSSGNYPLRCRSATIDIQECHTFENPMSSVKLNPNKSLDFSSENGNVVQIRPQEYNIRLRPGQTVDFHFTFKRADDYPADLYFLLDVSQSMYAVKKAIAEASEKIVQIIKKKTKNVLIGFGSFVDKNAPPYVQTVNSKKTYSYKNHLPLTDNVTLFRNTVTQTPLGINSDVPEGGLDALAQVLVCKNVIGWRDVSRKIVIFFTDAVSHSAGDGKLAGIYTPYDGKCYTENNVYTKELDLDYPSVGIVNKFAFENEVTVIFIVDNKVLDAYNVFNDFILGSISVPFTYNFKGVSFNSNNLETTLWDNYEKISTKIALYVKMSQRQKQHIKIQLDPDCNNNNLCEVNGTQEIKIKGNITLLKYFGEDKMNIDVSINGYTEKVNLAVEVINDCPCAKHVLENSAECNSGGTQVCGICECNPNRYGDKCMCTKNEINNSSTSDQDSTCQDANGVICNGRGSCICGTCNCQQGFTGQYCQCDSNSCPNHCNENGVCNCGVCQCGPLWEGPECGCSKAPCPINKDKSCTGRGICSCGACDCNPIAPWDARHSLDDVTCEVLQCAECHTKQCQRLQSCAYCQRDLNDCRDICHPDIQVHIDVNATGSKVFTCDDGKRTRYQYRYLDDVYGISLYVDSDKNRVENFIKLGSGILATLILVGIITLVVWKLTTDMRDRAEYSKFMSEHATDVSEVCRNPIYAAATTTFANPIFRRPSVQNP